eukprot:TRINITY_DN6641_c0_g1_i2.p1 TRINITY_DN6641_c0_g1~~TRINITY_DN6641_c0_g1_i2.p1  ORF type:complete len:474 (-),score=65.29 TRINITY_DN6641_c0_g1_i2:467-1888(-)
MQASSVKLCAVKRRTMGCLLLVLSLAIVAIPVSAGLDAIEADSVSCSITGQQACHSSLLQHKVGHVQKLRSDRRELAVYVYDLPDVAQRDNGSIVRLRSTSCSEWPAGSESETTCLFGDAVDVKVLGRKLKSRMAKFGDWKGLARIVFRSLQRHPLRTYNADEADLFFIPVYDDLGDPDEMYCPSADFLVGLLPHLTNNTASRHFWLTPFPGWVPETCDVFNAQHTDVSPARRLLAATTKLALEDSVSTPGYLEPEENYREFQPKRRPPIAENLHSIPYASALSGLGVASVQDWFHTLAALPPRTQLVSAIWNFHGYISAVTSRYGLAKQCGEHPRCSFRTMAGALDVGLLFSQKLRSTFCLEPPGDSPSRKGIVDSIIAGCIPVLFSTLQSKLWPWHVDRWEDVALVFDGVGADVISDLAKVPEARVKQLQGNMASLAQRFTYGVPGHPRPDDALDRALTGIWRAVDGNGLT